MLIDFQAFFALMAGDQLDLRIRQTLRCQVGDHLVAEQMRVDGPGNPRPPTVVLYDLLHASGSERGVSLGFKQVAVLRAGVQVTFQD